MGVSPWASAPGQAPGCRPDQGRPVLLCVRRLTHQFRNQPQTRYQHHQLVALVHHQRPSRPPKRTGTLWNCQLLAQLTGLSDRHGRALAHLRGRVDDATRALRQAEDIYPARVRRNPFARETVLHLLPRARTDTAQRELRGIAYRMGISA